MEKIKFFIKEEESDFDSERYLSVDLIFTKNRDVAVRFDLKESAEDFIRNNFCDDECTIIKEVVE